MPRAFLAVMKEQFQRPGQTLVQFGEELKELTREDKMWYAAELRKAGHDVSDPPAPTV